MITQAPEKRQRTLLIAHFLRSFFNSELVPRQAEARITLIQILALVATPGFVIMCVLLRKYARMAPLPASVAHLASLNEKCLFLYYSMVVIAFVAVLEWESLFPDRRDYLILSPLPVRIRTLFVSKAASLCIFLALFSLCVNAFPAVLYPLFASRSLLQTIRFILSHTISVFAANSFVFFACISVQGILLNLLGPRLFLKASRLVQLFLVVFLLSVFFMMPSVSFQNLRQNATFLSVFAPAWYLGLYETLLTGPSPEFVPLAARALLAVGLASLGFVSSYLLAYQRQIRTLLEIGSSALSRRSRLGELISAFSNRLLFRNSREFASFAFVAKTLVRSQTHRTYFGAYLGVGLACVVMGLGTMFTRHGIGAVYSLRSELLSIPLVMSFFVLLGLRVLFSLPTHLTANWLFRLADGNSLSDCLSGVYKAMVVLGVLPLFVTLFPFYLMFWGWHTASLHAAYGAVLSLLLIEILLFRFDKIPFTCSYTPGKANLKLWWWVYLFGFTNYAYTMTELEELFLQDRRLFVPFFAVSLVLLTLLARNRSRMVGRLSGFRYEGEAGPAPEPLVLSYKPF
jgi:hypothetical protein